MQAIEISDVRAFMQLLFQTNILDRYEFVSGDLKTDLSYSIDGHINRDFYNTEELEIPPLTGHIFLPWVIAKDKIFQLIKGKKTPSQLKIILKAGPELLDTLLSETKSSLNPKDIDGIFLNILYQDKTLNVICGISYNIFTLDKELEHDFVNNIITLFKSNGISIE